LSSQNSQHPKNWKVKNQESEVLAETQLRLPMKRYLSSNKFSQKSEMETAHAYLGKNNL
jgi:hypothetical protein